MKNYKDGGTLKDKILITYGEIKDFALDKTGVEMAIIDKWFVGIVTLVAIVPLLFGFCWSYSADDTEAMKDVQLVKGGDLYSHQYYSDNIPEEAVKLQTLRKGETVKLLAYDDISDCFIVELPNGNKGFIAGNMVGEELEEGSDKIREQAVELPSYNNLGGISCTAEWLDGQIAIGKTSKADVDDKWWGEPLAIKKDKNEEICYYPINVFDGYDIKGPWEITYTDGVISKFAPLGSDERDVAIGRIPGTSPIVNSSLYVRFNAIPITSDYEDDEDLISLPGWLQIVVSIAAAIIGLALFLFWIVCSFLLIPTWVQFIGRLKFLPSIIFKPLIYLSVFYGAAVIYVWWEGFGWIFTIIIIAYTIWQWTQWRHWLSYAYCPNCHKFYTFNIYDSDGSSHDYRLTRTTYRVTKNSDGKEIDREKIRTTTEDRVSWTNTDYLECSNCGQRISVTTSGDRKAY